MLRTAFRFETLTSDVAVAWQRLADALLASALTLAFLDLPRIGSPLARVAADVQLIVFWHLVLTGVGTYRDFFDRTLRWVRLLKLFGAWMVIGSCLVLVLDLEAGESARLIFGGFGIPMLLWAFQNMIWALGWLLRPADAKRVLLVGVTDVGSEIYRSIRDGALGHAVPVGFVEFRAPDRVRLPEGATLLGSGTDLIEIVKRERIGLVLVTIPMRDEQRIHELLDGLADSTASVAFVPDLMQFDLMQSTVWQLGGTPIITLRGTPNRGFAGLVKQAADLLFASVLVVILAPLLLAVGVAIRLTSKGPAILAQRRYGLGGKEIFVYKFRTMRVQPPHAVPQQVTQQDPRVTPLGRFLRRYSIDELPQLINVLQGRMSLVGPRPHVPEHNEQYRQIIRGYMIRHAVKPGMTGWAQVQGYRGPTPDPELMRARIRCDEFYLRNWSLGLDTLILWKTPLSVLRPAKGAL